MCLYPNTPEPLLADAPADGPGSCPEPLSSGSSLKRHSGNTVNTLLVRDIEFPEV